MMDYRLYHGDCLEIMPRLINDGLRVDAIVTDPPYGIRITRSQRIAISRGFSGSWDDQPASDEAIETILGFRVPTVIWGGNYFKLPPSRCWLVWDKENSGRDFADVELAWTSMDAVARKFVYRPMNMDGGKVHPTQKPVALMKWCIEKVSKPGDWILDPFMGSGTTGVACMQTGRNFIGIEIDSEYFRIAKLRIEEAAAQPSLLYTGERNESWHQQSLFDE